MPLYDTRCVVCGDISEEFEKSDAMSDAWRSWCKKCDQGEVRRVFVKAPASKMGGEKNEINSMKRSFDQRFVNSGEMDQVRHKHGDLFDESLMAGAVRRASATEKTHWDTD